MLQDTLPVLNIIIRRFKMNFTELQKANVLVREIKEIDFHLKND